MVSAKALDFTNVKDGGEFRTIRQAEGDYKAVIQNVKEVKKKNSNDTQWVFTIEAGKGTYPYYCQFEPNSLWKIRNLCIAAGITVPKKKVKVDPGKLVKKTIAVSLVDDEYDGKLKSVIDSVFPASELDEDDQEESDEEEDEESDDSETEEAESDLEELDIEDI